MLDLARWIMRNDDLWQRCAETLTGQKCLVRFQSPIQEYASGAGYRDETGQIIIDIHPCLSLERKYQVFLHECAHFANRDQVLPSGFWRQAPASIKATDAERKAQRDEVREYRADQIAAAWDQYAERHFHEVYQWDLDYIGHKLLALINRRGDK